MHTARRAQRSASIRPAALLVRSSAESGAEISLINRAVIAGFLPFPAPPRSGANLVLEAGKAPGRRAACLLSGNEGHSWSRSRHSESFAPPCRIRGKAGDNGRALPYPPG